MDTGARQWYSGNPVRELTIGLGGRLRKWRRFALNGILSCPLKALLAISPTTKKGCMMDESSYGYIIKIVTCNRLTKYISYTSYIVYIVYTPYTPRTWCFRFLPVSAGVTEQKGVNSPAPVFVPKAINQLCETSIT